ncbi:MAG: metal-dependent transcriptional regulator [Candidatus Longimicrobiales bacterium M2_2A_002]
MPDPIITLSVFALLVALLAVLLWPGRGLLARVRRVRRETERVRLEDGLKHLLDCERALRSPSLETMAGRLEVSRAVASEVLTKLTDRGLAMSVAGGYELTEAGRKYALRILRTHRLWERYLADRTGVPPAEWHGEAERVEHQLTEAEAEELALRLGDPRYDPHGDPIPTAAGEIPARSGMSLDRVRPDRTVRIVHLEDEPEAVFERLVSLGLAPGELLEVVPFRAGERPGAAGAAAGRDRSGRVRIRVRGEEHVLRAVDAANVTVELLSGGAGSGPRRTLAEAERGETVRVTALSPACQGSQRRRLLDLGVVPGTEITPELVSSGGDPVAYRIRGALIALRREQAEWIEIETAPAERAG